MRNPKGTNQHTARTRAKEIWDEIALECEGDEERIYKVIRKCWDLAQGGDLKSQDQVLSRTNPVVKEIDHHIHDEREPVEVPTTDERMGAVAELLRETVH